MWEVDSNNKAWGRPAAEPEAEASSEDSTVLSDLYLNLFFIFTFLAVALAILHFRTHVPGKMSFPPSENISLAISRGKQKISGVNPKRIG